MRSNAVRAIIGVVGVAVVIALFVVLRDDGESASERQDPQPSQSQAPARTTAEKPPPKPKIPAIIVRDGKPVGGVKDLSFSEGQRIRFWVSADVRDEIHVHGYDVSKEVEPYRSVSFDFPADIEGVFEVELERRAEPIAEIQVNP